MVKLALFVRLEAKPGKEADVAAFLASALALVNAEPGTTAWFAFHLGPSNFGIFDAFPTRPGRCAPAGKGGGRPGWRDASRAYLLISRPKIEKVDVLAAKLPG